MIRVILKHKNPEKRTNGKTVIKKIVVIFCLMSMFGIFWLLGAASTDEAAIFFEWPFIILNFGQGILLFVYIVVISARDEWRNLLTCSKYHKKKNLSLNAAKYKTAPKSSVTKETSLTLSNATWQNRSTSLTSEKEGDDIIISIGLSVDEFKLSDPGEKLDFARIPTSKNNDGDMNKEL